MPQRLPKILLAGLMVTMPFISGRQLYTLFSDRATLEMFLDQAGAWAPVGFVLLNIMQILIAPLPGNIIGMAGGYAFGFGLGFLLNLVSTFIGSILVFQLSKWYGKPLVDRFVGSRMSAALEKIATKKGRRGIAIMFLLPFLPDDALCFVAGLSPMSIGSFVFLLLVFRTPGILVASLTGAGLINLSLRGWMVIGTLTIIMLYVAWTKGDRIQRWFLGLVYKHLLHSPHED